MSNAGDVKGEHVCVCSLCVRVHVAPGMEFAATVHTAVIISHEKRDAEQINTTPVHGYWLPTDVQATRTVWDDSVLSSSDYIKLTTALLRLISSSLIYPSVSDKSDCPVRRGLCNCNSSTEIAAGFMFPEWNSGMRIFMGTSFEGRTPRVKGWKPPLPFTFTLLQHINSGSYYGAGLG